MPPPARDTLPCEPRAPDREPQRFWSDCGPCACRCESMSRTQARQACTCTSRPPAPTPKPTSALARASGLCPQAREMRMVPSRSYDRALRWDGRPVNRPCSTRPQVIRPGVAASHALCSNLLLTRELSLRGNAFAANWEDSRSSGVVRRMEKACLVVLRAVTHPRPPPLRHNGERLSQAFTRYSEFLFDHPKR